MQEETSTKPNVWLWIALIVVVVGAAIFFTYNYLSGKATIQIDSTEVTTPAPVPTVTTETTGQTLQNSTTELDQVNSDLKSVETDLNQIDSIDTAEDTAPTL